MRFLLAFIIALSALPVAAEDGFSLGLADLEYSAPESAQTPEPSLTQMVSDEIPTERAEVLAFQASLHLQSPDERTLALWNSDLGRVHYALAAEQAMLGREGLVNGGRMVGLGLATTAIGDGDPNGALGMALGRGKWAEMNANQKLQAGVEATILGALLAFMVSYAD